MNNTVLTVLVASAGDRDTATQDAGWRRFADAFLTEAIEAGLVHDSEHIESRAFLDAVDEVYGDEEQEDEDD